MDAKKNRLNINVDALAERKIKRRKKRDLNETVHYEINGKKVPIFTPEFLEENRLVEGELRKLRKVNNDFEEHNSVLHKYIESLTSACGQACDELRCLESYRDSLRSKLDAFTRKAQISSNLADLARKSNNSNSNSNNSNNSNSNSNSNNNNNSH